MALGGISMILIASMSSILFCGIAESHHLDLLKHRPKSTNAETGTGNPSTNTNLQNGGNTQQKPRLKSVSQWSQSETKENSFTQIGGERGRKEITQESKQVNEHFKLMSGTGNRNNGNQMRMSAPRRSNNIQQTGTQQIQNSQNNGFSRVGQSSQMRPAFGNFSPQQRQGNLPKQSQVGLNTIISNSNRVNSQSFGTQSNQGNMQNQPKFGFNAIIPGSNQASTQPIGSQTNQMTSQNSNRQQPINQGQLIRGGNIMMPQQGQSNQVIRGSPLMSGMQPLMTQNNQALGNQMTSQQQQQQQQLSRQASGQGMTPGQKTQQQIPQMFGQSGSMAPQATGNKRSMLGPPSGQPSSPALTPEQQTQQLVAQMLPQSGPVAPQTGGNKQSMLGQQPGPFVPNQQLKPSSGRLSQNQLLSSLNQLSKEELIRLSQMLGLPQINANANTNTPQKPPQTNPAQNRPQFSMTGQKPNMMPSMSMQQNIQNNQNPGNVGQNMLGKMNSPLNNMNLGNAQQQQNMLGKMNSPQNNMNLGNAQQQQSMLGKMNSPQNNMNLGNAQQQQNMMGKMSSPQNNMNLGNARQNMLGKMSLPQNNMNLGNARQNMLGKMSLPQNNMNLGNARQNMLGKMNSPQNNMNLGNVRQNMLGKVNPNVGNARQNMLGKMNVPQNNLNGLNLGNILGKISPNFNIQNNPSKTTTTNATESGKSKGPQTAQIRVSIKRKTKVTPSKKETPVRYIIPGNINSAQSNSGLLGSAPLSGQNFQQQLGGSIMNGASSSSSPMFSNQASQSFNSVNNNRFPTVKLPMPDFSTMLGEESPSFKPNMLLAEALDSLPLDVLRGTPTDPFLASLTGATTQTITGNAALPNNIKVITNPGNNMSTGTSASGANGTQDKMSLTLLPSHPGARPIVIKSTGNVLVSQYKDANGQTQYVIKTQTKSTTTLGPSAEEPAEYEGEEMTSTTQSTTGSVA